MTPNKLFVIAKYSSSAKMIHLCSIFLSLIFAYNDWNYKSFKISKIPTIFKHAWISSQLYYIRSPSGTINKSMEIVINGKIARFCNGYLLVLLM